MITAILRCGLFVLGISVFCAADSYAAASAERPLPRNWYGEAQKSIAESEYFISRPDGPGRWQSPNRAQNLRIRYDADGFSMQPRKGSFENWSVDLKVASIDKGARSLNVSTMLAEHRFTLRENSLTVSHEGFAIEYLNAEQGMRQNFIVRKKPEGDGSLRIRLSVSGSLLAKKMSGRDAALFESDDHSGICHNRVWYKDLKVWDAKGRALPAVMDVRDRGRTIELVANDAYAEYPVTVDPISTTPSTIMESNQSLARLGWSVSGAGDVNGDGYGDIIVGAPYFDNGQTDEGSAFIFHGSASGLSTTPAIRLEPNQDSALMGWSVSGAGDVNGDGYDDVVAGALEYDNGQEGEGVAFVYHGAASGVSATPAAVLESNQANSRYGTSVSGAGDVNGDGYCDIVIGALAFGNGHAAEGTALVYYGSASGVPTTPSALLESNQPYSRYGASVSGAGDVNGDGYADVIVGAPQFDKGLVDEGAAFIYHGGASGVSMTPARILESDQAGASFGSSVSGAGDVNGDGFCDVIVGAYKYDNGQNEEGAAFVYHGGSAGVSVTPAIQLESDQIDSRFGWSVSGAGDEDDDGYCEIIVGAYRYDNGSNNEGAAFVYHGSATGISASYVVRLEFDQAEAGFGYSVSDAGDVNGDGYGDIIAGVRCYDRGQSDEGAVFAYHGSASGFPHPTVQATNVQFSNVDAGSLTASWTRGNGAYVAVFMIAAATGRAAPLDNTAYTADAVFGGGTQIGASGWYCVYNGTGTSTTVSGLTGNTTYRVMVCEYNTSGALIGYLTTTRIGNPANQTTLPPYFSITSDQALTETDLVARHIMVTLAGIRFVDATLNAGNFRLNNAPPGCTIESVTYTDATHGAINLAFDGTDFDAGVTNLSVSIMAAELSCGLDMTSANNLTVTATNDAESIAIASDGAITEGAEDGEVITVTLTGGTFAPAITAANWTLSNLPEGVTAGAITRVDATHVTITLSGNRTTDYDSDITNLAVTCQPAEYNDAAGGSSLSASGGVTFTALVEAATVTIAADPALTESNLDAGSIIVTIGEDRFPDNTLEAGNFTLSNAPAGCTIESVTYTDATHCSINLAFDGTDFDNDVTNLGVTVNGAELAGAATTVSGNQLTVTATNDAESIAIASDGAITEGAEDGEVITVTLTGGTFAPAITAANWTLSNLPEGVTAGTVTRVDATHVTITLSGNRTTDYDSDITNLAVTCQPAEYNDAAGGSSLSASGGVIFTAVIEVPSAPVLISPSNGAVDVPVAPAFLWHSVPGTVSYRMQLSTAPDFGSLVRDTAGLTDTSFATTGLSNDAGYYWRVNAANAGGTSAWSEVCSLTTVLAPPSAVALLLPAMGDTIRVDSVVLVWAKGVPKVTNYRVDVATDSQFTNVIVDSSVADTSKRIRTLADNTNYWWRVRAYNAAGWGPWSGAGQFVVKKPVTAVLPGEYRITFSGLHTQGGVIRYALPKQSRVSLRVYDIRGRKLVSLVDQIQQPGFFTVNLKPLYCANGYQIVVFKAGNFVVKKKLVILR